MRGTKMTNEPNRRNEALGRFRFLLNSATGHFKAGEDAVGLNDFSESMGALENVMNPGCCAGEPQICFQRLLPALRSMYSAVRNQDITDITDLLETVFIPLANEWAPEG